PGRPGVRDERAAGADHRRAPDQLRAAARPRSHVRASLQRQGARTAPRDCRCQGDDMSDIIGKSTPIARPQFQVPWIRLAPWLYTLAFFLLWEVAVRVSGLPHTILPTPTRVFEAIVQYWGPIWKNSMQTLFSTMAGFGIAEVAGLALGLFVG